VSKPQGRVLIVGGGASGAISAIALIRQGFDPENIDIAEPRALLGEGLAYQTRDPLHRLNVPSSRMSAIEDLPDDFAQWSDAPSYSFMERRTYGAYLRERLGAGVTHIRDYVTDVKDLAAPEKIVSFASGDEKPYSALVLAMGHGKARLPDFLLEAPKSDRIIEDVWDGAELPLCETLICFGTGLTFIDVAMTHLARDSRNRVITISGSGNLPERHIQSQIVPFKPTLEEVDSLEKLRNYLSQSGEQWREAIDGLRPITEQMWRTFSPEEREEFLRSDGSAWSRRRHRIAPEVAEAVDKEIANGRIEVVRGKVTGVVATGHEIAMTLEAGDVYSGDYLALCIGRDYVLSDPLTNSLLVEKKTRRGPLNMGLSVDVTSGKLQDNVGFTYPEIYAIGPLRSGEAFESTAIPEIRKQASLIAENLADQQI